MNINKPSKRTRFVLIAAAALVVASTATAGAADLFTGKDVKNESLTGKDVRNGTISGTDVTRRVADQGRLLRLARRPAGSAGPRGSEGRHRRQG